MLTKCYIAVGILLITSGLASVIFIYDFLFVVERIIWFRAWDKGIPITSAKHVFLLLGRNLN